jgi:hypothetical protein
VLQKSDNWKHMPERLTQSRLAKALGVHRSTITKAIRTGRITPGPDGLFDLEEARRQWQARTRMQLPRDESLRFWQQMKTHYRAQIARLQYEHKAGLRFDREHVKHELRRVAVELRVALLENLPDRLTPLLVATGDEDECRRILRIELSRVIDDTERAAARALHELARSAA